MTAAELFAEPPTENEILLILSLLNLHFNSMGRADLGLMCMRMAREVVGMERTLRKPAGSEEDYCAVC